MNEETLDEVIQEIHRTRQAISERFHGDIYAIAADAARRQAEENRPTWSPPASVALSLPVNVDLPVNAPQEQHGQ